MRVIVATCVLILSIACTLKRYFLSSLNPSENPFALSEIIFFFKLLRKVS